MDCLLEKIVKQGIGGGWLAGCGRSTSEENVAGAGIEGDPGDCVDKDTVGKKSASGSHSETLTD
ncbi:hypothetical protein TIFTF001_052193 [Ficus carica]|uniref:Uncharacterized protein n=1 Tax=Ficus carica TaxID=3494 RepID=A0AA88JIH1_FICCA|nr:hypothetical protein TIFTF001_052193 [Ficus carica]